MERKAHNSLAEAALQVQLDESSRKRKAKTREAGGYEYGTGRKSKEAYKREYEQDWKTLRTKSDDEFADPPGQGKRPLAAQFKRDWDNRTNIPTHGSGQLNDPQRNTPKGRKKRKTDIARSRKEKEDAKKTFADRLFSKQGARPLKAHVEYDEVDSMVLEYFSNYFGDNLTEDTSDEDIIDAVQDLVDLTDAVLEAVGLERSN